MVAPSSPPSFPPAKNSLTPPADGLRSPSPKLSLALPRELPPPQCDGVPDAQNDARAVGTMEVNNSECHEELGAGTAGNAFDNGTMEESKILENGDEKNGALATSECKRRVQWNDSHGKELVHVVEFEASDTGDSEEDDDDLDESQSCTCTIQ